MEGSLVKRDEPLLMNTSNSTSVVSAKSTLAKNAAIEGINDVIFSKPDGSINYDFKGRLSFSWPAQDSETPFNYSPLFQYGYGLTYK